MAEFIKGMRVTTQETKYGEIIKLGIKWDEFQTNPVNDKGYLNIDIFLIFLLERKERGAILRKLFGQHFIVANVPFRITHGGMVRKAEDLNALGYRLFNVFPIGAVCMMTPCCVGVIRTDHFFNAKYKSVASTAIAAIEMTKRARRSLRRRAYLRALRR